MAINYSMFQKPIVEKRLLPSGAKARVFFWLWTAWIKPCPFKELFLRQAPGFQ
jgi:hypothetical protein